MSFFVGFFLDYYDSRGRYFPNGFVVFYDIVKIAMFKFPEIELKVSCRMVIGTVLSTGAGVRFRL